MNNTESTGKLNKRNVESNFENCLQLEKCPQVFISSSVSWFLYIRWDVDLSFDVRSRGHQVRGHPCKLVKYDIFYYEKKKKSIVYTRKNPTIKNKVN